MCIRDRCCGRPGAARSSFPTPSLRKVAPGLLPVALRCMPPVSGPCAPGGFRPICSLGVPIARRVCAGEPVRTAGLLDRRRLPAP
eukprot:10328515-Prorocentrum_lima.AAC.1